MSKGEVLNSKHGIIHAITRSWCYMGGSFYRLRVGFVANLTRYGFCVCCG